MSENIVKFEKKGVDLLLRMEYDQDLSKWCIYYLIYTEESSFVCLSADHFDTEEEVKEKYDNLIKKVEGVIWMMECIIAFMALMVMAYMSVIFFRVMLYHKYHW